MYASTVTSMKKKDSIVCTGSRSKDIRRSYADMSNNWTIG